MANLVAWLLAIVWPLAKKVLVSLGIGVLTYGGLDLIAGQVQAAVIGQWGQLASQQLQMATLLGIPQAIGIMLGGLTARVALIAGSVLARRTS